MPYIVTTTSGATLTTIADDTVNTATTSLSLVGKNYAGYGIFLNENFVQLLENFANSVPPSAPLSGQLWYDSTNTLLKFYTGSGWKPIHTTAASSTAPGAPVIGDLWWNTLTSQLNVRSASEWVVVGPPVPISAGTSGAIVETIIDTPSSQSHVVVKFYISNTVVGILSKDVAFSPATPIPGFITINPGFNLISQDILSNSQFWGNSSGSSGFNGLSSSSFLRADQASSNGTYTLSVGKLQAGTDLSIDPSATDVQIFSNGAGPYKDIGIYVNKGGSQTKAINIVSATNGTQFYGNIIATNINPTTDNVTSIGANSNRFAAIYGTNFNGTNGTLSATLTVNSSNGSLAIVNGGTDAVGNIGSSAKRFDTVHAETFNGTVFRGTTFYGNLVGTATGSGLITGNSTATGQLIINELNYPTAIVNGGTAGLGNIGAPGQGFNTIFAKATTAQYADLAERFAADAPMMPGTVVELGGVKEITAAVQELSEEVFGVISTLPGFLLNGTAGDDQTHPPVAVNGRVPVRVIGAVKKGDRLVSAGGGLARAARRTELTAFNVLGRSLEDKTTLDEGTIEAIVKLNS